MHFDLENLIYPVAFEEIDQPFLVEEIDATVKYMPGDKAPGPDGFNGHFIKKCWTIVKDDFYKLFTEFYEHALNLQSINGSFITLVPKNASPETINDYRPISLLGCPVKMITKLMANRLQKIISEVIHANQYGFIKSRTIQDCLSWAFQYLYMCHTSKKEIVILKLDFEKAFDKVEHHVIIQMLQRKGFSNKWIMWVQAILSSGTSKVLLNGVPGKTIHCKRGVRQGDPLSPLLFVLATDLLQSLVNDAHQKGLISLPLSQSYGQQYPIVQYADDTLIIMPAITKELFFLKGLLQCFADSTGLKVNFGKSFLVPINLTEEKAHHLAATLGCQVGSMPFTYLGLPLGTTKPLIADFMPILNRIERRLMGISPFATYAGRLELNNSVLTALPTYSMCIFLWPQGAVEQVDKYRRHSLWRGSDLNRKGNCLVAWEKCQRPKDQGGLGIINLAAQNKALLLKHLHKFYNKADVPWVKLIWSAYYTNMQAPHSRSPRGSFWWRDLFRLADTYRGYGMAVVGKGDTTMFWRDNWNFGCLHLQYPHLFSFAREPNCSVLKFMNLLPDYDRLFHLPLSQPAAEQLGALVEILDAWDRNADQNDQWVYVWGTAQYSSKQVYNLLIGSTDAPPPFQWLWKSCCQKKHKVFLWLLLQDRLNTRNLLRRKRFHIPSVNCVLCANGTEETVMHLFFGCGFSQLCWTSLHIIWDLSLPLVEMVQEQKSHFLQDCFMEVITIAAWTIWTHRNSIIFDGGQLSFPRWKMEFRSAFSLTMFRAKPSLKQDMELWLATL